MEYYELLNPELVDPELQAKLMDVQTPEELLEIAKLCGVELEDDQLLAIAGGSWCDSYCAEHAYCRTMM